MTPEDISIGQFVEQIAVARARSGDSLPLRDERPWHKLFYRLQQDARPGRPRFLEAMSFDWDGPYPRSQELSAFLQALHWNACVSAANPHFEEATLSPALRALWDKESLAKDLANYVQSAAKELTA